MRELLEFLRVSEERSLLGGSVTGRRMLRVEAVLKAVQDAAREVVVARSDEDRARVQTCEPQPNARPAAASLQVKLLALRRQHVWTTAVELAWLACLLLSEAAGGQWVSPDEAGPSIPEESRELVGWMVAAAERAKCDPARGGGPVEGVEG